mmetsp:Transcript_70514/g.206340  ORF Transcript_70514/g.206340 Transcript_70514/m.206340 type:complete len:207 (+) Transcript_70514:2249-2869(+)
MAGALPLRRGLGALQRGLGAVQDCRARAVAPRRGSPAPDRRRERLERAGGRAAAGGLCRRPQLRGLLQRLRAAAGDLPALALPARSPRARPGRVRRAGLRGLGARVGAHRRHRVGLRGQGAPGRRGLPGGPGGASGATAAAALRRWPGRGDLHPVDRRGVGDQRSPDLRSPSEASLGGPPRLLVQPPRRLQPLHAWLTVLSMWRRA